MAKRIHHLGMTLTRQEHDRFHNATPDLTPKQHAAFMKKMGITKEQDEEWHRTHLTLAEQRAGGLKRIEPAALGAGFVDWCVKQGWLIQKGKDCFVSKEGLRQLRERYDISL